MCMSLCPGKVGRLEGTKKLKSPVPYLQAWDSSRGLTWFELPREEGGQHLGEGRPGSSKPHSQQVVTSNHGAPFPARHMAKAGMR